MPPGQRRRFRPSHWPHYERHQRPDFPGEYIVSHCTAGRWKHSHPGKEGSLGSRHTVHSIINAEESSCYVLMRSSFHKPCRQLNGTTKSFLHEQKSQQVDVIWGIQSCGVKNSSYYPAASLLSTENNKDAKSGIPTRFEALVGAQDEEEKAQWFAGRGSSWAGKRHHLLTASWGRVAMAVLTFVSRLREYRSIVFACALCADCVCACMRARVL